MIILLLIVVIIIANLCNARRLPNVPPVEQLVKYYAFIYSFSLCTPKKNKYVREKKNRSIRFNDVEFDRTKKKSRI